MSAIDVGFEFLHGLVVVETFQLHHELDDITVATTALALECLSGAIDSQ